MRVFVPTVFFIALIFLVQGCDFVGNDRYQIVSDNRVAHLLDKKTGETWFIFEDIIVPTHKPNDPKQFKPDRSFF